MGSLLRLVSCQVRLNPDCVWFGYLRDPAWGANGKLYGIENGLQLYVTGGPIDYANPASNSVSAFGPSDLNEATDLSTTPDGATLLFVAGIGTQNIYAFDVGSQQITQLTSGGNGQRHPRTDGRNLFYIQDCCASASGSVVFTGPVLHRMPFRINQTTDSPMGQFAIQGSDGPVSVKGTFGVAVR